MRAGAAFGDRHVADCHIGTVVVRDRAGRLAVGEADATTAVDKVAQVHEESLIELDVRVAADRDADRAAGLTGVDRQRAAGCCVVAARSRRVIGGRVIDADVGIDRLAE